MLRSEAAIFFSANSSAATIGGIVCRDTLSVESTSCLTWPAARWRAVTPLIYRWQRGHGDIALISHTHWKHKRSPSHWAVDSLIYLCIFNPRIWYTMWLLRSRSSQKQWFIYILNNQLNMAKRYWQSHEVVVIIDIEKLAFTLHFVSFIFLYWGPLAIALCLTATSCQR